MKYIFVVFFKSSLVPQLSNAIFFNWKILLYWKVTLNRKYFILVGNLGKQHVTKKKERMIWIPDQCIGFFNLLISH